MWYSVLIEGCQRDEVELVSEALELSDALSISLSDKNDDPILEPTPGTMPLWPEVVITALYDDETQAENSCKQLHSQFPHLSMSVTHVPDQDWVRAWMDDFKPMRFGERLWVCPSWLTPPDPDAINLILDPGLAFGTGTHATTSLCLSWLGNQSLDKQRVIDFGCGSGILAIAAMKLGAQTVQAVDIDEQALIATTDNAQRNAIDTTQMLIAQPDELVGGADLIVANILLAPLMDLKDRFKSLLKPAGQLVVSGILADQAAGLIDAYQDMFVHQHTQELEGWSLLVFSAR